nr:hypothetical protein HmN_000152400 [Hymenolepis microstoma]
MLDTLNKVSQYSPDCRTKTDEQDTGTDLVEMTVFPVFQRCQNVRLTQDEIVMPPKPPFIAPRSCPPGTFMSQIPPIRCEPCPADTFSDPDTEPTDCLPCGAMRSSTHGSPKSSSLHCTNALLDQERERLVRKFASRSPPEMLLRNPPVEDFDLFGNGSILNETELMIYLSPEPFLLEQQKIAEDLFKIRQFFTKCFHRHHDNRPSWIRRKSMALKSGNIYKIQEAQAGEKEADYYYQMRIKLKKIMLADPNFVERTEGEKIINTRPSIYAEFKGDIPDVPDYTPIHKLKLSIGKTNKCHGCITKNV